MVPYNTLLSSESRHEAGKMRCGRTSGERGKTYGTDHARRGGRDWTGRGVAWRVARRDEAGGTKRGGR